MRNFFIVILLVGQFIQGQSQDSHVVYFDTGQYDVPVIETNRLVLFIQELKDIEIERISIYGFTDDRGSDNYNLILSQNTLVYYRSFLMRKVMDSTGMGETYAAHEAVRVIEVYLKLLESMGVNLKKPVKLYVDNEGVCKLQNGLSNMTGAKHYRIAQAYIVDRVNSGVSI